MLFRSRMPKTLLWVFYLLIIFLMMFTAYRIIIMLAFMPRGEHFTDMLPTFFLGLRFDLRWISIVLLPIIVSSLIPECSPFYNQRNRKVWTWYLAIVTFILIFFFAADFGCFAYNKTRIAASALNFVEDPKESALMLWQSYPIVWMVIGLLVTVVLLRMMFRRMHNNVVLRTEGKGIRYQRKWFVAAIFFFAFLVYGNVGSRPLKWNTAFRFNNSFKSFLALNPLQNFVYSLKLRRTDYDETRARAFFPLMQQQLGLSNSGFSFERKLEPTRIAANPQPNIVLVMCESMSMYKSSMSGNPLNTTPYLKSMADSGVFFSRCFTPHFSTARGLFATITGIPDVQLSKFSTRNPQAIDQHTIINNFEGYQKLYFLGGNPGFNNFEGLVSNIRGLQINAEGKFSCKPIDVWGISDKDLFMEANTVFSKQTRPFFAIIQTADNHRPFTIPQADQSSFPKRQVSQPELEKYGFESEPEFNAFRYADYCIEHFIEKARTEKYFANTVFVFIGDHGVSGNARNIYPEAWTTERLTEEHVPLLFYAPALLKPSKRSDVASQVDVLPSIAGIAGQEYTNTTLGRDLFHPTPGPHYAFAITHDEGRIGLVADDFYFSKNLNFDKEEIHFFGDSKYDQRQIDSMKRSMSALTSAYYETARWMLVHNKK